MENPLGPIGDGAKIAVVGGGPAGSFFALHLLKLAEGLGIQVSIDIYNNKSFATPGPAGCNMCAGAIGHQFVGAVEALIGKKIPPNVIKQDVTSYALHLGPHYAWVKRTEDEGVYTVFRGAGPRCSDTQIVGFDQFLEDESSSRGANIVAKEVREIVCQEMPSVLSADNESKTYDLVVGAFGVNSPLAKNLSWGYRPPGLWRAMQAEISIDSPDPLVNKVDKIHIYASGKGSILFSAITPKTPFFTLTAIGQNVQTADLKEEIEELFIGSRFVDKWNLACFCRPSFPVTLAKRPCTDRVVIIGDACASRYLKNGIESALFTALLAARAVIHHGVSEKELEEHFAKPCRARFEWDNRIGRILFGIQRVISKSTFLSRTVIDAMKREQITIKDRSRRRLSRSLWHLFTGDLSYRKILQQAFHPKVGLLLFRALILRLLFIHSDEASFLPKKVLANGVKIAVIGGGPAGASAAIKLLRGARELGLNIEVKIFEGKDFNAHYNQCIGVLSPPLTQILKDDLGLDLPPELIKKTIKEYKLYSDHSEITLPVNEEAGPTYTVRRNHFDSFMLATALNLGAVCEPSRVEHIEFTLSGVSDEVHIYHEAGFWRADCAIIACGMDWTTLKDLRRATRDTGAYHAPRHTLQTVVAKLHGGGEWVERVVGNTIHAFLPSNVPGVLFGAVTPKGEHVVVNIAGRDVTSIELTRFMRSPKVRSLLPDVDLGTIDCFKGEFPCSPCANPYGDRFVAVGDTTGWMRPFKGKGINTAVITGITAAAQILRQGISRRSFAAYKSECLGFARDYSWGVFAKLLCVVGVKTGFFDRVLEMAKEDGHLKDILYYSISAEKPYREIFLSKKNIPLIPKLAFAFARHVFKSLLGIGR